MTFKLLIAEDASDVAEVVAFAARLAWPECQVTIAADGVEALDHFAAEPADLVILDVAMPPPDGFAVCQQIRDVSQVPILMLTAHDSTLDKIRALDIGADDYLTKPFDYLELLARLRALMRRASRAPVALAAPAALPPVAGFSLDAVTHEVRVQGTVVPLTSTEYRLLEELVRHAGTVLPHHYLLGHVWGAEYAAETHYLKGVVQRLRRKLGDDSEQPRYIQTEWGVGYRFIPPTNAPASGAE